MRFLADAGISPKTVDFLKQLGHDATHVRTLGLQRAPDTRIVDRARTDGSIVLSLDLDFGDILALGVMDKPSAIIFRLADELADSVNARLSTVLTERSADLESGALILIEDTRYRTGSCQSAAPERSLLHRGFAFALPPCFAIVFVMPGPSRNCQVRALRGGVVNARRPRGTRGRSSSNAMRRAWTTASTARDSNA